MEAFQRLRKKTSEMRCTVLFANILICFCEREDTSEDKFLHFFFFKSGCNQNELYSWCFLFRNINPIAIKIWNYLRINKKFIIIDKIYNIGKKKFYFLNIYNIS